MKNTEALRAWVNRLMVEHRLTQAELARRTGITAAAISTLRHGQTTNLKDDTVTALCNFAGISKAEFLAISQGSAPGTVGDATPVWHGSDLEAELAMWLREQASPDARSMVLAAARLAGFHRGRDPAVHPIEGGTGGIEGERAQQSA